MKKLAVGIFSAALILGAGTAVFAAGTSDQISFTDMLPFMEKMHPDLSNDQLEEMYNNCHGEGGMMSETNGADVTPEDMMSRF